MRQSVDELVHGLFFYLTVVQGDTQVGREIEFASKVAQDALKESVNGLYAEVVVIVE